MDVGSGQRCHVKILKSRARCKLLDHLCFLCRVFLMLSRLFIAALWSPPGKGLTSWLLLVMFNI